MSGSGSLGGGGDWLRGGIATVLSNLQNQGVNYGQTGQNNAVSQIMQTAPGVADWGRNYLADYMQAQTPQITGTPTNLQNQFNGLSNSASQAMQGGNAYTNPLIGGATQGIGQAGTSLLDYAANVNNRYGALLDPLDKTDMLAGQEFAAGGWTPQYEQGFNQLTSLLGGQVPGLQNVGSTADSLIGSQGANAFNQGAQQLGMQGVASGGWTPQLSMALNPVQGILNSGGNTNQSNALMGAAAPYLATGGQTQLSQGLGDRGMQLASGQALMTPGQAASLAGNQAATGFANQAQAAETQAMRRGGGAGATVANGLQNQGMADFADQAAQGISNATSQALQGQQALQLNQQGQGLGAAQGAGGLQNNMFGTAGGLAQGSGSLANALMGTGLSTVPALQNSAANTMQPYENLALGGAQNQLGMLGAGSGLAGLQSQTQLGGVNAINSLMGNQNQYTLGLGNLQNGITNNMSQAGLNSLISAGNLYNNAGNLGLGQGQLGVGQAGQYTTMFNSIAGALNPAMGNINQMGNTLNNIYNSGVNPLTAIMQAFSSNTNTGLSGLAQLFGGGASTAGGQNPMTGSLLSALGGLLGG